MACLEKKFFTRVTAFCPILVRSDGSRSKLDMALARASGSPLGDSRAVSPSIDTQFTPDPFTVNVTDGHPQYMDSAKATPKASFRVMEGNANTSAA